MGVFKVLLWKHWVVRKRRYIQTFIELMTPISLILAVFILKEPMQRKVGGDKLMIKPFPVPDFSLDSIEPPAGILYTPDSDAAYLLMKEVTATLNNRTGRPNKTNMFRSRVRSLSFPNSTLAIEALLLLTSRTKYVYAMVEFENMERNTLPEQLKYTIRMSALISKMPTVRFQRLFEKFENVPQSFLLLQWAIDRNFLKLKSGNEKIATKVHFQGLSELKAKPNKTYGATIFFLLSYFSFGAPMLPFVFLMNRLLEEKATGIQELVKMEGVTTFMLIITQLLNSMPSVLIHCIVGTTLLKIGDSPIVPMTHPIILFLGLFLHFMTMIFLAFVCSNMISSAENTISMSIFMYIGMWIPVKLMGPYSKSDLALFLLGFLPHIPAYWFLNEALVAETRYEVGLQFDQLTHRYSVYPEGEKNACVLVSYIMQLVQLMVYSFLTWYLGKVNPGKYGIPMPWKFLFTKEYWSSRKKIPLDIPTRANAPYDPAYEKYFEDPPNNMEAGIQIQRVYKVFELGTKKEFVALSNVNLNIYRGEITVLLGHNGAGKTTLISIITGMIKQTSGKVYVNGKDTVTQQAEVRKQLGYCPQHNLYFPDLTVLEHLMFFSLIKGGTFKEARLSSYTLMDQLDLKDHSKKKPDKLSGGLLRRLQLGCALCGDASVLILDEPTSGLDVEARRELWDTLLSLRGDRTLVLTTHFMEEADVLGDRMAALHLGKLRCHATPMFLKKAVGSGVRVVVTTKNEGDIERITQVIKNVQPKAELVEVSDKNLFYLLPPSANVLSVFKTLEGMKEELDIDKLGARATSLEEVFIELCCDVDTKKKTDRDHEVNPAQFKYISGFPLIVRQTRELIKRQIDYSVANKWVFVLLHMLMPFILCTSLTQIFNILDGERNMDLSLDLDMYSDTYMKDTFFSLKSSNAARKSMATIKYTYPNYYFTNIMDFPFVHSINLADQSGARHTELNLDKYITGIAVNDTEATVLYSPNLKHSAPVGLNLLSNMLAIQNIPGAHGRTVVTKLTNTWPMKTKPYHIPKTTTNCSLFAIFNICTLLATTVNDVGLSCRERVTVARHTHIMAGCPPYLYWLVTFLYHMFWYMCFCCTATLIAAAYFDNDKTIDDGPTLRAIFVVVTMSGMNTYAFMYFVTFCFEERKASMLLVAISITFGFLFQILVLAVEDLKTDVNKETLLSRILNVLGIVLPVYMFVKALLQVTDISRFNSFCIYNADKCPNLSPYTTGFDPDLCCEIVNTKSPPFSHFSLDKYAAGKTLIIIVMQFIAYSSLVLLLQYGYFNRWWDKMGSLCKTTYPNRKFNDPTVNAEKSYVLDQLRQGESEITDTILIHKAWKVYRGILWRRNFAVKRVSFSIKKGECFGILGLNGAGKTSTFKLITKEESLTKGKIYVNRHTSGVEYLRSLGYCPQFCGLDYFRSGKKNLSMLLVLRGLSDKDVKRETAIWLEVVGMTQHAHRKVSGYSGGMVRRLSTSAALCSGAPLTLLDEPTAGVDTAARRLAWAALQKGIKHDRSIAISSHCMDEIEKLCKRVTILTMGEMSVLGTPQALKDHYAPGHTVVFKLRADMAQSLMGQEKVILLKRTLDRQFKCSIKDKHLTSLHYRINEMLPYSVIFNKLEGVVAEYSDLIEDFSVTDTTLEDVFLAFAVQNERSPPVSIASSAGPSQITPSTYELL